MLATGHPPFSALPLALAGLGGLFWLFGRAPSARRAAWLLWWFGLGHFLLALSWLVDPFLVDPWRHLWLAPFAVAAMAGGLALFWAGAGALAFALGRGRHSRALALVAALTLAELLRTYAFTGFPWALIGHIFIGWPPMQAAALVGAGGLTLAALALAALLGAGGWRGPLLAGLLLAGLWGFGLWRQAQPLPPAGGVVRLVQPAVPQSLKWDPERAAASFEALLAETAAPPGPPGPPEAVIWPETAFPWILDSGAPLLAQARAAAGGARLFTGVMRAEGARIWNALVEIGPDGQPLQVYDKHHLVPFGEYVPLDFLLRPLGLRAMTAAEGGAFSAGPGPALLDAGALGRFAPLICYEAIFPQDVLATPARPDFLLQATNDAWFGTFQGPQQHLAQARLRAVETGLPLLRAANTGISAAIDARGALTASLPLQQRGHLDVALPGALPPTLYARSGDGPLALLLLALLAVLAASSAIARKSTDPRH